MLDTSWRKSSLSFSNSNCVQARTAGGAVEVRDSKDQEGPVLRFTAQKWKAFLAGQR